MKQWRANLTTLACKAAAVACLAVCQPAEAGESPGLPGLTDAEQVQNAISLKLSEVADKQRDNQRPKLERVIGDIHRTVHLSEERLALLRIAAEGVLQRTQDTAARSMVAEAEKRTKGVPSKQVGKVLSSMEGFSNGGDGAARARLWQDTLRQLLTEAESKQWEAVVASREAYRSRAVAEYIMLKIKPVVGLDDSQAATMLPLLEKSVQEYLTDAGASWSSNDEERDLYAPYAQMLLLGIPEKEARAVVTDAQWEKWQAAAGEYAENWRWVKELHDKRVKKAK